MYNILLSILLLFVAFLTFADQNYNQKELFTEIYENHGWKGGINTKSGSGSELYNTKNITKIIPVIIKKYNIKTVLDAACGDFYYMNLLINKDLGIEKYLGTDIVESLITENNKKFSDNIKTFKCLDLAIDVLPKMDLIICRDCLIHMNYQFGLKIINNFKKSGAKYLLITTYDTLDNDSFDKTKRRFWYPINLQLPPFNFPKPILLIKEDEKFNNHSKYLGLWEIDDLILNTDSIEYKNQN